MVVCLSANGGTVYTARAAPGKLLVGTVDGVMTLERAAPDAPWQVTGHSLRGTHVGSLLYEPRRGGLFAGAHGSGLYTSLDGGQTWELCTRGLASDHVWSLAAAERDGAVVLYAGTEPAHLFQSTDYGANWEELPALRTVPGTERWCFPPPPHIAHVKAIAVDPRRSEILYVGVEQGALLKSTDAGQSWRELEHYVSHDDVQYKDIRKRSVPLRCREQ